MNKGFRGQQKRAEHWYSYSALSEDRKIDICKIRREAYAQRTALVKEAIKNAQINLIGSMETSKEVDGPRMYILVEEDISNVLQQLMIEMNKCLRKNLKYVLLKVIVVESLS